jgi:formylglycine-generating enzyme required for sulfatase activity
VVPVQLALFVDLVRTRPWTPATLHDLGAAAGPGRLLDRVGVAFLEDSFNSRSATPSHKLHAAGAKRVLEALLPDAGAAIRGHKRSTPDLRSLSGYDARPADFLNLLRILDGELRLVTPTDPPAGDSASGAAATSGTAYYQLTHDYLVPALREWLSGDRRRSAKGRAELALAERTAFWSARNETQQLPTLAEWVQIRWLTRPSDWRPAQRRMMGRADRVHGSRVAAAALVALVATLGGLAARGRVVTRQLALEADGAVRTLLAADVAAIPAALEPLARHRDRVVPVLREVVADDADDGRTLRATLGLAALAGAGGSAGDEPAFALLAGRLPVAEPDEVAVIVDRLAPRAEEFAERYRGEASDPAGGPRRLRAAAALAAHGTGGDVWSGIAAGLAEELVDVPTVHLATWLEALRGVRAALVPAVVDVFRDPARREVERSRAADILADYAADDPAVLAAVATTAEPRQFATLAGAVGKVFDRVAPILEGVVTEALPVGVPASAPEREHLAIRQAKAAAVLLRYGRPERVWPMFVHTPDPRVRSELMHFVKPFAGEALADTAAALADRLGAERDVSAKRALVLTLGDVVAGADAGGETLGEVRARVVPIIRQIFETDPDPGLHAAAEWTLRQWGERPRIRPHRGAGLAADPPRLAATRAELVREGGRPAHWYVNAHGQTLVVVAGPVAFTMGSPETEEDHLPNERQRDVRIAASFAIGATPVTRAQYQSVIGAPQAMVPYVLGKMGIDTGGAKGDDVPMVGITWLEAAAYCNKLGRAEGLPEDQLVYMESAPGGAVSGIHADHASRTGYRLPTEAEWEFTVRAGAVTSRPYGETTRLLGEYAIFGGQVEEAGPVGARKPNDLGLFDGLGNVWTWTQDLYDDTVSGGVDHGPVTPDQQRAKRGGDYRLAGRQIRVAFRNFDRSDRADINAGFRIARTIAPLPDETRPRAEPRPAPERNTGAR